MSWKVVALTHKTLKKRLHCDNIYKMNIRERQPNFQAKVDLQNWALGIHPAFVTSI